MKQVVVFCGSSSGKDPAYAVAAYELGKTLAKQGIGLVYGGAKVGLMGAVAQGSLDNGGQVIGVLPYFLSAKEIRHDNLTEIIMVDTMHQRKAKMDELSDGIITLPGGFGTMEELFEMLTWAQLGLHKKPIGILNINGYYDELLALIDLMVSKELLKPINRAMVLVADNIVALLEKMQQYEAPEVRKWIDKNEI
jgi:uncharacterized protein (TIGR00730 family)